MVIWIDAKLLTVLGNRNLHTRMFTTKIAIPKSPQIRGAKVKLPKRRAQSLPKSEAYRRIENETRKKQLNMPLTNTEDIPIIGINEIDCQNYLENRLLFLFCLLKDIKLVLFFMGGVEGLILL